jgi:hypothetical protein
LKIFISVPGGIKPPELLALLFIIVIISAVIIDQDEYISNPI